MAKRMRPGMKSLIRHVVREGVREGRTRKEIFDRVETKYGQPATRTVVDMVREEERRQSAVNDIMGRDKRKRVDLGQIVGCTDAKNQIRAYITLHWINQDTGLAYNKGYTVTLGKEGRLADILNKGIQEVTGYYISKNYPVPTITSANTSGKAYYRMEYIECA